MKMKYLKPKADFEIGLERDIPLCSNTVPDNTSKNYVARFLQFL